MRDEGRGLVWRRLAAAAIDGVLFVAAASLASVALYMASGGVVRAYAFLPATHCEPMIEAPGEVAQAAQRALGAEVSRVTAATACRRSFLGLETGRFVSVTLEAQQGETLLGATVFQPVDQADRPVQPVSLGWVYPLVFVVCMAIGEGTLGGTPGKAALALRVTSACGGRIGFARALGRNLVVYAWLVAGALMIAAYHQLAPRAPLLIANASSIYLVALGVLGLVACANLMMLLVGRSDPAYDRWTGVRVTSA